MFKFTFYVFFFFFKTTFFLSLRSDLLFLPQPQLSMHRYFIGYNLWFCLSFVVFTFYFYFLTSILILCNFNFNFIFFYNFLNLALSKLPNKRRRRRHHLYKRVILLWLDWFIYYFCVWFRFINGAVHRSWRWSFFLLMQV